MPQKHDRGIADAFATAELHGAYLSRHAARHVLERGMPVTLSLSCNPAAHLLPHPRCQLLQSAACLAVTTHVLQAETV